MGSFTVQNMLGSQALITGTDSRGSEGSCIVSTQQWDEIQQDAKYSTAKADFDATIEAIFAPVVEAAEKLKEAEVQRYDEAEYVVLSEEVEGVEAKPAEIVPLTIDSIILRLIDEDDTDRLVWITESKLGVLAKS